MRQQQPAAVRSGEVRAVGGPSGPRAAVPPRLGFWEALRRSLGAVCC